MIITKVETIALRDQSDGKVTSSLDIGLIVSKLRATAGLPGVVIGARELFRDPAALVVEGGNPAAAEEAFNLTEGMILVSRDWEELANNQVQRDP